MSTEGSGGVVMDFPAVFIEKRIADLRTAAVESFEHFDARRGVAVLQLSVAVQILEARFVDDLRIDDADFRHAEVVICVIEIVGARSSREVADADVTPTTRQIPVVER